MAVVALGGLTAASSTRAQDTDPQTASSSDAVAKGLFDAGRAAYDAGDFQEALLRFQEAYERSKRPQLLYNVGLAADRLRQNRTALTAFQRYLDEAPEPANRQEVENRIRTLEQIVADEERAARDEALTPTVAAATMQPRSGQPPQDTSTARDDDGGLLSQWWFWTITGVVISGAVLTAVLVTSGDDGELATPNSGLQVETLRWNGP
jgi:tetratricopeptide (TPR) repeat protein